MLAAVGAYAYLFAHNTHSLECKTDNHTASSESIVRENRDPEVSASTSKSNSKEIGMVCGVLAGVFHGVSITLRKKHWDPAHGSWSKDGKMNMGWFSGLALEFLAGLALFPSTVLLPVQVCWPLFVLSVISTAYALAVFYLGEKPARLKNAGLLLATTSYTLLFVTLHIKKGDTNIRDIRTRLVNSFYLPLCSLCIAAVGVLKVIAEPVLTYSVAAAVSDAIIFPSTRLLGEYISECYAGTCGDVPISTVLAVVLLWKMPGVLGWLYFQQLALRDELYIAGALFCLSNVVLTVAVGAAYFGETIDNFTFAHFFGVGAMLTGFVLLSLPGEAEGRAVE